MNGSFKIKHTLIIAIVTLFVVFISVPAFAQGLNNSAWTPQPSNRASIAALIRQVEQEKKRSPNSDATGFTGSSVTQLICGSNSGEGTEGSSANAQANSSCIILNNSNGALNINQESDGAQAADANSMETITVNETINGVSGSDDVLAVLTGE